MTMTSCKKHVGSVAHVLAILLAQLMMITIGVGAVCAVSQGHADPFQHRRGVAPSIQAFATTDDGTIYAGSFGLGVFVSHDHGDTWKAINTGLDDWFILCLTVDRNGMVYAGTVRGGIFRMQKAGMTWEAVNQGLRRVEVKSLLAHQQGLYAGTGRGVYQWHEADQAWVVVATGLGQTLVSSLVMMTNQRLFAGTAGKGVFWLDTTLPGTATWQRVKGQVVDAKERLHHQSIRILAKHRDETLFVGTQNGGIFHSRDDGASWYPFGRSLPNDSIRGIVSTNAGVFVATGQGIYRTTAHNTKWIPVNTGLIERAVQVMIVTPHGDFFVGASTGAFRSQDRGNHWVNISKGLGVPFSRPRPFF